MPLLLEELVLIFPKIARDEAKERLMSVNGI